MSGTASATNPGNTIEAFRWTAAGEFVGLGFAAGGASTAGNGISGDGNVVVGNTSGGFQAMRWTAATGSWDWDISTPAH